MTMSENNCKELLENGTDRGILENFGFITTVFRDNSEDDYMEKYYQMVLTLLD